MSWRRFRYNPIYVRIKISFRGILLPLIIFQFIRTLLLPLTFDVILLGLLSIAYVAILLEWI